MVIYRILVSLILIVLLSSINSSYNELAAAAEYSSLPYEIKWLERLGEADFQDALGESSGWLNVPVSSASAKKPAGKNAFLVRFTLPMLTDGSGILFDGLTGMKFKLLKQNSILYEHTSVGDYPYHRILVPLHASESGVQLLLYGEAMNGKLGITKAPLAGPYNELSSRYAKADMTSMILGLTLLFVAAVMLICSMFLTREQLRNWLSLSITVMSIGIIFIMNCPFPYLFFSDYAVLYDILSAAAVYICLPVSAYFFEHLLDSKWKPIIRSWRNLLTLYGTAGMAIKLGEEWTDGWLDQIHTLMTSPVQNILLILTVAVIFTHCVRSAVERNREAMMICIGFALAITAAVVMNNGGAWPNKPLLQMWEWPLTFVLFHLIVLLGKQFVNEHAQAASYIKELELFEQQLHESEQREAASQLAASVAHEVRNPLSVTRGFLQLLTYRNVLEKEPLQDALQELDHAHDVISNYLKYAKPESDDIKIIDVNELLQEALTILNPLLFAQGVTIDYILGHSLYVKGRSSQLKQAMITLLKHRINSVHDNRRIDLQAFEEEGYAVIRIVDEAKPLIATPFMMPHISLTNQITDAGLLFALRSIEAMNGKLIMRKKKGGSELIIRLQIEQNSKH
ncbi:sensor histidine kinase [Paenibacillus xylaniclasticus]|uniref:sensor histidine kinase n=1 Tax=Paenibacillus xylaniclasticus TaxID=588083 RepID=UPI000FDC5124|nr:MULTISPECIES: HAMP domain-containing sensor histidine kinase [Paenibacillus]GFN32990.1 hypothetical protein PCURB6_32500 [Paenibacillus curdlanolyticus]